MTIDERIEILEMEYHWSMMDKDHLGAIKAELTRLRVENGRLQNENERLRIERMIERER